MQWFEAEEGVAAAGVSWAAGYPDHGIHLNTPGLNRSHGAFQGLLGVTAACPIRKKFANRTSESAI